MKIFFIAMLTMFSALATAPLVHADDEDTIDTVTDQKYEALKIWVTGEGYNEKDATYSQNIEKQSLDEHLDPDYDRDDFCTLKQYVNVLDVLLENPIYINRLNITDIHLHMISAPQAVGIRRRLKIELYSDPYLKLDYGFYYDVQLGKRRTFCKVQSVEKIRAALNQLLANR